MRCVLCRGQGIMPQHDAQMRMTGWRHCSCALGQRFARMTEAERRRPRGPNTLRRRVRDLESKLARLQQDRLHDLAEMEARYEEATAETIRAVVELRGEIRDIKAKGTL